MLKNANNVGFLLELDDKSVAEKRRKSTRKASKKRFCGKRKLSREQAKDVIRKARFQRQAIENLGGEIYRNESRSYLCGICQGNVWHVTSQPLRIEVGAA